MTKPSGDGKGKEDPEVKDDGEFLHPLIRSASEYADAIDDDDPPADPDDVKDDDDDDDDNDYSGLDAHTETEEELRAEVRQLREEISRMKPDQTTSLRNMTKEQVEGLAKENPIALMTLMVEHVLQEKGYTVTPSEVSRIVNQQSEHSAAIQRARAKIVTRFDPANNPKLEKKAREIYQARKKAGITLDRDPQAEYQAYLIAADEHPELLTTSRRNGNPRRQSSTAGGTRSTTPALSDDDRRIADAWGIDIKNPKNARRISEFRRRYDRLDAGRPRRGGR